MLRNFSYLIDKKIAGSGFPGSYGDIRRDVEEILSRGFKVVVSLTEESLSKALMQEYGIDYLHIPVPDFEAPTMKQVLEFIEFVNRALGEGKKVLVHCWAGYGRTGTMLACYLVSTGVGAGEAIERVRKKRFGSIETRPQEEMVHRYEEYLAKGKKKGKSK